jgi:hypothetical protein
MALVGAGCGVEDDHAVIEVPIGDVELVRLPVDEETRRPSKVFGVVAPLVLTRMADLQEKLAGGGELEDLIVFL